MDVQGQENDSLDLTKGRTHENLSQRFGLIIHIAAGAQIRKKHGQIERGRNQSSNTHEAGKARKLSDREDGGSLPQRRTKRHSQPHTHVGAHVLARSNAAISHYIARQASHNHAAAIGG